MLDGLAFLPESDVLAGMAHLKSVCPPPLAPLAKYFDETYVSGKYKTVANPTLQLSIRHTPPLYAPEIWNVYQATLTDGLRTNNNCEAWHNGFKHRIGMAYPTVWALIDWLKADCMNQETTLTRHGRGFPVNGRQNKEALERQEALKNLCERYRDGLVEIPEFLEGVCRSVKHQPLPEPEEDEDDEEDVDLNNNN